MRNRVLLATAAAAAALVGLGAMAATSHSHVLVIHFPDGSVERLNYTGDTLPSITIDGAATPTAVVMPMAFSGDPFAQFARIEALMDREMSAMMAGGPAMGPSAAFAPLSRTAYGAPPPGARSYTMVSTFSGGHACTRSVEVTSSANGAPPKVVRQSSGDCAAHTSQPAAPALAAEPAAPKKAV